MWISALACQQMWQNVFFPRSFVNLLPSGFYRGNQIMGRNTIAKRAKPVEFISHDPLLIEAMKFSSQEFYARVEKALAARQIPDASVTRVDWKEGGPLSAKREYLRVQRERFV